MPSLPDPFRREKRFFRAPGLARFARGTAGLVGKIARVAVPIGLLLAVPAAIWLAVFVDDALRRMQDGLRAVERDQALAEAAREAAETARAETRKEREAAETAAGLARAERVMSQEVAAQTREEREAAETAQKLARDERVKAELIAARLRLQREWEQSKRMDVVFGPSMDISVFGHRQSVGEFSPDGRYLSFDDGYSAGRIWFFLWDVGAQKKLSELRPNSITGGAAFVGGSDEFVCLDSDSKIGVWKKHVETAGKVSFDSAELIDPDWGVAADTFPDKVGASRGHVAISWSDGQVRVWDREARRLVPSPLKLGGPPERILFSRDGARLAVVSDRIVMLWDLTNKAPESLEGHPEKVTAVAFLPDGKRLATADAGGNVRVWDLSTKKHAELTGAAGKPIRALAVTQVGGDVQVVAGAGDDGGIYFWDAEGGPHLARLALGEEARPIALAFGPEGRRLAALYEKYRLIVWRR